MRIAMAQTNPCLGDFKENTKQILEWIRKAVQENCDLVIFPELSIFGYHPGDLLERESIVNRQISEFDKLCKKIPPGISVLLGLVHRNSKKRGKKFTNSAALLHKGKKPKFFNKELLPTYDVFDDHRHIEPGNMEKNIFRFKGKTCLVTICEDIWGWGEHYSANPIKRIAKEDVDIVLNLSGSPYTTEKWQQRSEVVGKTAKYFKSPMVYVNLVGGQDELVFDGGSFAVDAKGKTIAQASHFSEDFIVVDLETNQSVVRAQESSEIQNIRKALVLGIRDFANKVGLKKAHLGLSGGIDSAVVACLAVEALGPDRVTAVAMPSEFNAAESLQLAKKQAENLNCRFLAIEISEIYQSVLHSLGKSLGSFEFGLMNENIQARARGLLLMAIANKENSLLLSTGNKAEYATGFSTLYGDMCGGLAPIADLVKSRVYELAELYNLQEELIPQRVIARDPSAELRPNQKDSDSLPAYKDLDRSVSRIVDGYSAARGETERWVLKSMMRSEFKRWQAPPIIKVTSHAFGRGRRFPIAHRALD